jgi:transcriptional regulator of arginine metabolism
MRYVSTDRTADGEQGRAALEGLLPQLFDRIDGVGELIVLHTVPGGAQPVAAAFDAARWPDVLGTVGGDDTILIVCRSASERERVIRRIEKLAEG